MQLFEGGPLAAYDVTPREVQGELRTAQDENRQLQMKQSELTSIVVTLDAQVPAGAAGKLRGLEFDAGAR